jgi:hypothetical protein
MAERPLRPESALELRIHLDKLKRLEARCRDGLEKFLEGCLSRDTYLRLLGRQRDAQQEWERKVHDALHDPAAAVAPQAECERPDCPRQTPGP